MKIKALIVNMDGQPDRRGDVILPGSIKSSGAAMPVLKNFNLDAAPIGTARLVVEGDQVFAEMEIRDDVDPSGLYPGLAGMGPAGDFQPLFVGVCDAPNSDARIPPIRRRDD